MFRGNWNEFWCGWFTCCIIWRRDELHEREPIKGVKRAYSQSCPKKMSQSTMCVLPKSPVSMRVLILLMLWFSATIMAAPVIEPSLVKCRSLLFPACFIAALCPPTCHRTCLMDCAACKPVCSKFIRLFYHMIMMFNTFCYEILTSPLNLWIWWPICKHPSYIGS